MWGLARAKSKSKSTARAKIKGPHLPAVLQVLREQERAMLIAT